MSIILQTAKAIGVLSLDVSGPHLLHDERIITELAQRRGYTLSGLITLRNDAFTPTALIAAMVCRKGVAAVIAPSMVCFHGRGRPIAVTCDVITPTKFAACSSSGRSQGSPHE
ncbi:hypothetical protein ACIBG0_35790 [Nocardia sp. NPDC050630]|uniref:hypothetical protein n=1 Tax=Nocardia sp. NPDC050630 TaxID=3364321 RepID=UPI00378D491F